MTRNEENRLIAEKCEGRSDFFYGLLSGEVCYKSEYANGPLLSIDDYFTNISACIRAAEAWEAQVDGRGWALESKHGYKEARLVTVPHHHNNFHIISRRDSTPAAALAAALVEAVK